MSDEEQQVAIPVAKAARLCPRTPSPGRFANSTIRDRISFIEDLSTNVSLPEKVDVIISDLRGVLPISNDHIKTIVDARTRFLQPDGVLIPQKDTLWAAVVTSPELYSPSTEVWSIDTYGIDLRAGLRYVMNTWNRGTVSPEQMLTAPQQWAELDYSKITDNNVDAHLRWIVTRRGLAHGLVAWFDTILSEGIGFSNAPGGGADVYGSAFLPWTEPVSLAEGDIIEVKIRASFVDDDYIWTWETSIKNASEPDQIKASFRQSTFFSLPLSTNRLSRISTGFVPRLNTEGRIDRMILSLMEDECTHAEIAERVLNQFPENFSKVSEALTRVARLSSKYSQ
jgi:protein arginine N-methyltransferase 1